MKNNVEKKLKLHICFLKNYKKNTAAIFLSFSLTFLLLTVMLVLLRTNFQISNLQAKLEYAPGDCYIDNLSWQQIDKLKEDPEIEWVYVQQGAYTAYQKNNQTAFFIKAEEKIMTMTSKMIEGTYPKEKGEVAAEKWALLNLGIEPAVGATFRLTNYETGVEEEFCLTGILSDVYRNKKSGVLELHSPMDVKAVDPQSFMAYLQFRENVSFKEKIRDLQTQLRIERKQIKENPARENYTEFYVLCGEIVLLIFVICMVIFYGIYRIAVFARVQQYGILRALGMKKKTVHKIILAELFQIYMISVPVGISSGILLAYFIMVLSGNFEKKIFLFNESVKLSLVIPIGQLAFCVLLVAVGIAAIGCRIGKRITDKQIVQVISGEWEHKQKKHIGFSLDKAEGKTGTLIRMGCKYIVRDFKTSCFVILTICLGITLFTGLAYETKIAETYRSDIKERDYLNGQYVMSMLRYDNIDEGVSRSGAEEIMKLEEITDVKTSSALPVRIIDENDVVRNDDYYDEYNKRLEEFYGYSGAGFDGVNQIYHSKLCGYNTSALKALENFVVEGDFSPEKLREDEVILSVLRTKDDSTEIPGSYQEGTPLMGYQVGDEITYKYRQDLQTDSIEYDSLQDRDSEYVYRTVKIVAIVSFPYILDCDRTVYPLLITDDRYIRKVAPESSFQCLYLEGKQEMSKENQKELERTLIRIGNQHSDVSTRSLIDEIQQNERLYQKQMVYIYSVAIVSFILVIINMINNLHYRMQVRTREVCMLRAIGLSVSMTKKMIMIENVLLGSVAVGIAFVLSNPVLKYLFKISDMEAFGHSYSFEYPAFICVSACALLICVLLSVGILKEWKARQITEGIGKVE